MSEGRLLKALMPQ